MLLLNFCQCGHNRELLAVSILCICSDSYNDLCWFISVELGFDKNLVHPYSALSGMRGWKSKMLTTKELAVREIKRRDPTARTNRKNKTVEELLAKFRPLTDPRDIVFITKKEGEFREKMLASLEELEEEKCNKPLKRKHADIEVEQLVEDANAENELVQSNGSMSYIAAEKVIAAVEELARSNDWKVCIAVADAACNPIMVKRQDGAMLGSFDLAVGKAKAAVHYFSSTPSEKGQLNDVGSGSMAILINGVLVGGVGVSGARPAKLDKLATTGANALKSDEI